MSEMWEEVCETHVIQAYELVFPERWEEIEVGLYRLRWETGIRPFEVLNHATFPKIPYLSNNRSSSALRFLPGSHFPEREHKRICHVRISMPSSRISSFDLIL